MEVKTETKIEPTVKDMLNKLIEQNEALAREKKVSWWKLPWKAKLSKMKISKGYSIVIIIKNSGELEFQKLQNTDGTVKVDGIPRVATIDYKLHYKGKPVYIIPEWSIKAFSPVDNYADTVQEKMNVSGRKLVLAKLMTEQIKEQKKPGSLIGWIILGAAILGVGYYLMKGGSLF